MKLVEALVIGNMIRRLYYLFYWFGSRASPRASYSTRTLCPEAEVLVAETLGRHRVEGPRVIEPSRLARLPVGDIEGQPPPWGLYLFPQRGIPP